MQSTRKRKGSGDIPFGYNLDSSDRHYIVPNEEHLESLQEVEESVVVGFLNLREGTEWLKYKTGKDISIKVGWMTRKLSNAVSIRCLGLRT